MIAHDQNTNTNIAFVAKYPEIFDNEASMYSEIFGAIAAIKFILHIEK